MGTEKERETSLSSRGSLSDLVVGFFEEIEGNANPESDGEGEGEGSIGNDAERKAFWETQRQLLHVNKKKKNQIIKIQFKNLNSNFKFFSFFFWFNNIHL